MIYRTEEPEIDRGPSPEGDRILLNAGPSEAGTHEVEDYLHCERWWAFGRSKRTPVRRMKWSVWTRGAMIHTALAHDYVQTALLSGAREVRTDETVIQNPEAVYSPLEALRLFVLRQTDPEEAEIALSLYPGVRRTIQKYLESPTRIRPQGRPIGVEWHVRTTLPGGRLHTARLDAVEEDPSGRVTIVDHKTTDQPMARAAEMYAVSLQLSTLACFGRMLFGDRFAGVLVNLVRNGAGTTERVRYNAPYLTADTPALLDRTRNRMHLDAQTHGDDPFRYAPTGMRHGCREEITRKPCPARSQCLFRTPE